MEKELTTRATGFGIRTGDVSGGVIAIDLDGFSASDLVEKIQGERGLPESTTWTSCKDGRTQILYQIPDEYRDRLKDFTRMSIKSWGDYQCKEGEQLELRYNKMQSVLPFSYHPETGMYKWTMHPLYGKVAIAPRFILDLVVGDLTDPASETFSDKKQSNPRVDKTFIGNRWEQYLDEFEYRPYDSIPLVNCLSPTHRDLVQTGVGQGGRDNTATAIAMDAVGCEQWLNKNGQAYDGSAEDIVREFCSRCSPPLSNKDATRIYKSAQKKNGKSSIEEKVGDNGLKAIVASHFWKQEKANYYQQSDRTKADQVKRQDTDDSDKPTRLNDKALIKYCRDRLNLRYNEITREIEIDGECLSIEPYLYLVDKHDVTAGKDKAADIFMMVAKENTYNPVKDYLESLTTKPISITNLASRYLGTENPLYDLFIEKMLIGAVARAYQAGCKLDTALVLQGEQGIGKSSFFDVLGGDYFDDSMGNGSDKDDLLTLHRSWIQEWGELDRIFGKKAVGEVKSFLSKRRDNFREPYARKTECFPRHSIIVGSVNDASFLNDSTGARRFWVVPVETSEIDIPQLKKERDQIWAAAVQAYKAGKTWWLTKEEEAQSAINNQQFQIKDEWQVIIEDYLSDNQEVTVRDILENALGLDKKDMGKGDQMRVTSSLITMGWKKTRKMVNGKRQYIWTAPPASPTQPAKDKVSHPKTPPQRGVVPPASPTQHNSETLMDKHSPSQKNDYQAKERQHLKIGETGETGEANLDEQGSVATAPPQSKGEAGQAGEPIDKTIPVEAGDKLIHRAWNGQIITSTVERIETKKVKAAPLSSDKKMIQNIHLNNAPYISSDSDDLIEIKDQWGKIKWQH